WEPTNADINFIYTTVTGYDLGIFDVDDFDTTQNSPLMLNTGASSDTVEIVATGGNFTATSLVTTNTITLFNDNQFVLAITDGTDWFEPLSWFETAVGSNIYEITFSNGLVTSIDAVPTVVPVPAAAWLFGSGLLGLVGVARRKVLA
ncbi:MAG: VPLPA-CTERM sorting domain-containing protein, partial [Gammaproteobacteria bacterium]